VLPQREAQMEQKNAKLGLVPNSKSCPSSTFFFFAPFELFSVQKKTWME
jgi:hypothetical protein